MSHLEHSISNMITKLEYDPTLRDWFIGFTPTKEDGYMFSKHPNMDKISNLVVSDNHSGASFAYTCREVKQRLIQKI